MKLRTGCDYWTDKARDPPLHCPPLNHDCQTEVAILGAGITGALAAHYLLDCGTDCVLLDRRDIGQGSTAASTGLLQYEIDKPLVELAELVGSHAATRAYQLGVDALREFGRLGGELHFDCGFARTQSLLLAASENFVELLKAEHHARRAAGIAVDFLTQDDLKRSFQIDRPAALLSHDAAVIDPFAFTTSLIRHNLGRGLRAFGQTRIDTHESDNASVTLTTATGHQVRAAHVIFATGYETPQFVRDLPVKLMTTYAMAVEGSGFGVQGSGGLQEREARSEERVLPAWSSSESPTLNLRPFPLIWETGSPYFYLRPAGDGHLLIGGEDDDCIDPQIRAAQLPDKANSLQKKLHALFPHLIATPDCIWAGTFAQTADALPFIGPHQNFPRGLFALGYGGNGITFGQIAARMLCDAIKNDAHPDMSIFRLDR